jgi:hypothetical protein
MDRGKEVLRKYWQEEPWLVRLRRGTIDVILQLCVRNCIKRGLGMRSRVQRVDQFGADHQLAPSLIHCQGFVENGNGYQKDDAGC